jgi:hypothetical protein
MEKSMPANHAKNFVHELIKRIHFMQNSGNIKTDPVAQINIAEAHKGISEHLLYKWQKLYSEVSNYPSLTFQLKKSLSQNTEGLFFVYTAHQKV